MNMELYNELQTVKHLSSVRTSKQSRDESSAAVRPRTISEYKSPDKSAVNRRSSENNMRKDSTSGKSPSGSIESDTNRLVHSLTMENRNLVERIAHLETVGFYQRQKLEAANCLSLAAEMEQLNVEEVIHDIGGPGINRVLQLKKALTIERETVRTLQKYMETLTHKLLLAGHIDVFQQA